MAGKIVADQIEGTTTTETVDGASVTIPNVIDTKYVVNGSSKAWLTCVGDNTAIDDSLNVSSLTDVTSATGRQNYSTSFNNLHYSFVGQAESTFSTTMVNLYHTHADKTASATQFFTVNAGGGNLDTEENCTQVLGDLA